MLTAAKIVFTGLATIVSENADNISGRAAVVFTNARSAEHVAYIAVPVDDYDLDAAPAYRRKEFTSRLGAKYAYVELEGEVVTVDGVDQAPVVMKDTEFDHPFPANLMEAESLHWVPNMRYVWPRMWPMKRRARESFLRPRPDPEIVAARFNLPAGDVKPSFIETHEWRVRPRFFLRRRLQRAFAHEVALSFEPAAGGVITFKLERIANDDVTTVRVRPRHADAPPILMANTPLHDIAPSNSPAFLCGEPEPGYECTDETKAHGCHCVDHHFRQYYRMFVSTPDEPPLPHLIRMGHSPIEVTALRVGGANCGPTRYK